MSKRKKNYLQAIPVLLFLIIIVFIFDLPKTSSFITLGVLVVFNIFVYELFIFNNKKS